MLRPQGLFQSRLPAPAEWQPPVPPAYPPPGGQYPQASQYPQGAPWGPPPGAQGPGLPGNQYPQPGAFQQATPSQTWGVAPTGAMTAAPGRPGYPAGGQYPQPGAYQEPYPGAPFPDGQYGQFAPGGGSGATGLLGKLAPKRPRGRLVPVAAAVVGVAVVVGVALALSSQGGSSNSLGGATAATALPRAGAPAGTGAAAGQAAAALSGLLAQSGGDRADVGAAVVNVEGCGKDLGKDVQVFDKAAANRHALLSRLQQLPGRSALPPAMISDLIGGWQASATVDTDLAQWAKDQAGHCEKGNTKDPRYAASIPFDSKATNDKNAFVQLWNPLARKDGLPARQASDL